MYSSIQGNRRRPRCIAAAPPIRSNRRKPRSIAAAPPIPLVLEEEVVKFQTFVVYLVQDLEEVVVDKKTFLQRIVPPVFCFLRDPYPKTYCLHTHRYKKCHFHVIQLYIQVN